MTLWNDQPAMTYSAWSANAQDRLDHMADVLTDIVRVGANLSERLQARHQSIDNSMGPDKLVALLLLRNMLACADAISILLRSRTADPILPQLRQLMEIRLSLRWLLADDQVNRGRAYTVCQWLNELNTLETYLPESNKRTTLDSYAGEDDLLHHAMPEMPLDQIRARVREIETILSEPKYADIAADLRARMKKRRGAPWYSVFEGPRDLRSLCRQLNEIGAYEFMYRELSASAHGQAALRGLHFEGETVGLIPLRLVESIPTNFLTTGVKTVSAIHEVATSFGTKYDIAELLYLYWTRVRSQLFELARTRFTESDVEAPAPSQP